MNGGVSCAQFDCEVDEHVIFSRVAQVSWQLVVDLSCSCDVLVVSSCGSEKTPLVKKVQWSSLENRRGHDVMSTSFWFQGVPRGACFVVCPHVVFNFGVACRVVQEWCAFDCDSVCDVCF